MDLPSSGGRYARDPRTGALSPLADAPDPAVTALPIAASPSDEATVETSAETDGRKKGA